LPEEWDSFRLDYTYLRTTYRITVMHKNESNNDTGIFIDGTPVKNRFIRLLDDGTDHLVIVIMP
jgi:cellobiose phosphorylase